MEKLVSSWFSIRTIPEGYIFPPDIRPGKLIVPLCKTIPVIDLSMAEARDRNIIIKKVLNASQEFGFFQLINHGVSENLMDETMDLFKEFFDMPADDKASVYSDDPSHLRRLFTSSYNYGHEEIISNGKLKNAKHRAVTNSNNARTTIVTFFNPCHDSIVEPAKALINGGSPPLYRAFQYKDFLANYTAKTGDTNTVLEPYKLQA
ncbi:hyoscyamine 6-dioxygenase-like [Camellia sinensis]|uniref:hyoscyamine 6-dioxygenase-like n=1 Tax=Camellia sinensis TaxID=4442 RepID=UPI0010358486|nr:hyoscyamine 6-dioxygenase-like [Camellia sinensis]